MGVNKKMKIIATVNGWIGKIVDCDECGGGCGCQFVIEKGDRKKIIKQKVKKGGKLRGIDYMISCPVCSHQIWIGRKRIQKHA
jgi:hypothetical protein